MWQRLWAWLCPMGPIHLTANEEYWWPRYLPWPRSFFPMIWHGSVAEVREMHPYTAATRPWAWDSESGGQ
jgi:hypothetical protein